MASSNEAMNGCGLPQISLTGILHLQRGQNIYLSPEMTVLPVAISSPELAGSPSLKNPFQRRTRINQGATAAVWPVGWKLGCVQTGTNT